MTELKSKHLWPLVEQFATTDTSDPENTVPGWVALAMLDDLRRLNAAIAALEKHMPQGDPEYRQSPPVDDRPPSGVVFEVVASNMEDG